MSTSRQFFPFIATLALMLSLPSVGQNIIPKGGDWKYFDKGFLPAADWMAPAFDDTNWSSGPSELGYGDGDEATLVSYGADANNKYTTTYFRTAFNLTDTTGMAKPAGTVLFDDGVVLYVNGNEVFRNNMPAGAVGYSTFALGTLTEGIYYGFNIPVRFLLPGRNVIAAEVHQNIGTSSDISFNLELNQRVVNPLFTSNLPLVLLEVAGAIPDEPKVPGTMKVIFNRSGAVNKSTDAPTDYNGNVGIEIRGSTSQGLSDKKPYAIELRDAQGLELDTALLDMPREHDWILLAPFSDKTLIREALIYGLGRNIMSYAPRVRFCEVLLNGEYQGVYMLAEKIKRDDNRVDVSKLLPTDVSGDELTGGYIIKIDKTTGGNIPDGWVSSNPYTPTFYQYHYPQASDIMPEQKTYIRGVIDNFEAVMSGLDFANPVTGYPSLIDVNTFVDYLIMNELSRNVDGYRLSTYMYKDKDSNDPRLKMGPIWDYNITLGNADYCEGGLTTGFAYNFNQVCGAAIPFWWERLLSDPKFRLKIGTRWAELRQGVMSTTNLMFRIDSMTTYLQQASVRNFQRYPIIGVYIWPNSYVGGSYAAEVTFLKNWITERLDFLDVAFGDFANIPYEPYKYSPPVAYPNPAEGTAVFGYYVREEEVVTVEVRDPTGRTITSLVDNEHPNGWNTLVWEIPDRLPTGLYVYTVNAGGKRLGSGRLVLR